MSANPSSFTPLKSAGVHVALAFAGMLLAAPTFAAEEAPRQSADKVVCDQSTGTRVTRYKDKNGSCLAGPGHTVSREQLDAVGTNDLGDALARSIPALTTTH